MTISLVLTSITGAIKNLTITGVTVKDYNGIAASWQSQPNVLYPNPEGFITDFSLTFPTLMRGASADADVHYTLHYRFLGSEVGDLSQMPQEYGEMVTKVTAILNKLLATDAPYAGTVEMEVADVSIGARADPAGNMYHGADIALRITEMQNA